MEGEHFIVAISERLSALRTMSWACITHRDALRPEVLAAFAKFASLRHLKLVYYNFASFGDLKKVVVALPALSSLTLTAVVWDDSADPDESSYALAPTSPTLSKLCLHAILLWPLNA